MFNILSIPTLMIVRDRVVLCSRPGALPEAALADLVEQAREYALDLAERKQSRSQFFHHYRMRSFNHFCEGSYIFATE